MADVDPEPPPYQAPPQAPFQPYAPGGGAYQPPPPSTLNIGHGLAVVLAYLFGWIGGLVVYLIEKRDLEVRFHAAQSILLDLIFVALSTLLVPFMMMRMMRGITTAPFPELRDYLRVWGVGLGLSAVVFLVRIVMMISGGMGKHVRLPVIGKIAERWAAKP